MTCAQFRGYLFEIFVSKMLQKNGFIKCENNNGTQIHQKPCELISQDGEIQGRGTKHQIDFVGIYERNIPFIYPLRILVECKYYKNGIYKNVIREFIGAIKDIDENYFYNQREERIRFLNVPIVFSATFFQEEAINLAWAHGINTISYYNIPVLKDFLEKLDEFVLTICGSKTYITKEEASGAKKQFSNHFEIPNLQTFLFATTEKGLLINLVSKDKFPDELFENTDERDCEIYFFENNENQNENINRVFYISLNDDNQNRRFYFQANDTLMKKGFSTLPLRGRINEKMKYFRQLTIIKRSNGLYRIIKLNVKFRNIERIL